MIRPFLACLCFAIVACKTPSANPVSFGMWAGDAERNRYFENMVIPLVRQKHGITLRIVPNSDTAEAVSKLRNEKAAGITTGTLDVLWINGENFRVAREAEVLHGPFTSSLQNIGFYENAARERDFGTPIEGYEAPWQKAQFVFAYDTARVPEPPRSFDELRIWVKKHPGRFTYIAPPDFTGSAFIRHVLLRFGGDASAFQNKLDEALYARASTEAVRYLNEIKPFLWKRGETYPTSPREQDRLFANNEVDFAMSYTPSFASERIGRGEFPPTTRTFLFESGSIGNYNYLAIPFNAPNLTGALKLIDHLMSFDEVLAMCRELKITFPQLMDRLTPAQRAAVKSIPKGVATLPDDVLARRYLPEPDASYVTRFEKDWQRQVLRP